MQIVLKMLNPLFGWMGHHFSLAMYIVIWIIGSIFAFFSFYDPVLDNALSSDTFGKAAWWVRAYLLVFFFATLAHQLMVYVSLHGLEKNSSEWAKASPKWIGTNLEIFIRILSFFSLFIIGQKISIQYLHDNGYVTFTLPTSFPILCVWLFGWLLVWDVINITRTGWRSVFETAFSSQPNHQGYRAFVAFFVSDLIALIFWAMVVAVEFSWIPSAALLLLAFLPLILYCGIIAVRLWTLFQNGLQIVN